MSAQTPSLAEWAAIKAALTPEQVERIKAKCEYEQRSWLGVYMDWPTLFAASSPDEREPPDA